MKAMNAKSFWIYALFGAGVTLLAAYPVNCGFSSQQVHPEYRSYLEKREAYEKKYDAWAGENKAAIEKREFEEVISGTRPVDSMLRSEKQEMAKALLALKPSSTVSVSDRAQAFSNLFFSPEGARRAGDSIECGKDGKGYIVNNGCRFTGLLAILSEPVRLAKLWSDDPQVVAAALTVVSDPPGRPMAEYPAYAGVATELPGSPLKTWFLWSILSGFFALGYFVSGFLYWAMNEDDSPRNKRVNPWSNPFLSMPNFVLGWVMVLAVLPGYLAIRLLHLCVIDARPALDAVVVAARGRTFADEFEKFNAQLEKMKTAAAAMGEASTLARIEQMAKKVREAQNLRQLSGMKASLEHMSHYITAVTDVEREFSELVP
jgi:hypothetical protein